MLFMLIVNVVVVVVVVVVFTAYKLGKGLALNGRVNKVHEYLKYILL